MNILVIGATSQLGQEICQRLKGEPGQLTAMTRSANKLADVSYHVVVADTLDLARLTQAMQGQDIVVSGVSGKAILDQAKNIEAAAQEAGVKRIYWITGMGIHHEIKGARGLMLNLLLKRMPEYAAAADVIGQGPVPSTLLRLPNITGGPAGQYEIGFEGGPQPKSSSVSRQTVAVALADLIAASDPKYENASISITNG